MDDTDLETTPVMMAMFNDTINQINQTLKQLIDNQNQLMKGQYEDNSNRTKFQVLEKEIALITINRSP